MQWLYHTIRYSLVHWGYWAVLAGLLSESAGVPVPGETTLMFASFLAHKGTQLHIYWIIIVGTVAAIAGDNLGFFLGRKFGATLLRWMKKLFHLSDVDIDAATHLIRRRGAETVFFARYVFGLRTIAGPLAGILGMEWKRFLLFNFLGAITWVTIIGLCGWAFASEFQSLLDYFEKASWAISGGVFVIGYLLWRRYKKNYEARYG